MISTRVHPALISIAGIGVLSAMDLLLKIVGARHPTFQLVFMRFAFGLAFALLTWAALRPALPDRAAIRANLMRGTIVTFTGTFFFFALQTLPLAEAVALSFLSPLFLALFGALILGEKVGPLTIAGLVFGVIGMLVMTLGKRAVGMPLYIPGALAAIASAVSMALALVLLRQRAQKDALITIIVFQNAVPAAMMAIPAYSVWTTPALSDLGIFTIIGMLGIVGHLLLGLAFKRAEAARLAPTEYSALIFAVFFGFAFFDEMPGLITLAGVVLIVIGTALAMRQDGHEARRSKAATPAD